MSNQLNPAIKVIVGSPSWTLTGVNVFSVNLVRGLLDRGVDARILLTEEHTILVSTNDAPLERPAGIPFVELPVEPWQSWGGHWGATIAYLENQAPCIYIPNHDWRHSSVSPLLSNRVFVVGIVHSDDPLHYDHVARLGRYWNAVVATSSQIAAKTVLLDPTLRERLSTIPIGVQIPATLTRRTGGNLRAPLRAIYHGVLKQQQKRILDLPGIVARAAERGVGITLTIAGGGPDEALLRAASENLVAAGMVRFLGVIPHDRLLPLLEEQDVYLLTSEFEGMPNALLEAMGRGCIPVVSHIASAIPDLVIQGENGFILPVGDLEGFVDRLEELQHSPALREVMARQAHATVRSGPYGVRNMVDSYLELFSAVTTDHPPDNFCRPRGELNHPPAEVAGIGLLPLQYLFRQEGIGCFPNRFVDYCEFQQEVRRIKLPVETLLRSALEPLPQDLSGITVIIAAPAWTRSGMNDFSLALARGLGAGKLSVRILLTEEDTDLVTDSTPRMSQPDDVTFVPLPVERTAGWGGRWGAVIRYLEENAPCVYIPNHDWRHSVVTPLLSHRVAVVGVVHHDDPCHRDHLRRLGRYWDAIVTFSDAVAAGIHDSDESLGSRIAIISPGSNGWTTKFAELFRQLFDDRLHCIYARPMGLLNQPPAQIDGLDILPLTYLFTKEGVGSFPNRFFDYGDFQRELRLIETPAECLLRDLMEPAPLGLAGITVIIGAPAWTRSGINDFSETLARALGAENVAVRILLTEEDTVLVTDPEPRIPQPEDLTFVRLPVPATAGWGGRWGAIISYLEENAPCVYIPNHDWRHSCVTPLLSNRVAVVGIMHGDDPCHDDHLRRLGRYWDAVVTFSDAVAGRISHDDPTLGARIAVIARDADDPALRWSRVLEQLLDNNRHCLHQRPDGVLNLPPARIDGIGVFPVTCAFVSEAIGALPSGDTDPDEFCDQVARIGATAHPRILRFMEENSLSGRVRNESVFRRHDYLSFSLLTCAYIVVLYRFFSCLFTLKGWSNHPLLYGVISIMVMVTTINVVGRWLLLPLMKRPLPMEPPPGLKTAVITTFVGRAESLEMLAETVRGMINLEYPHDNWVLDEDDDAQVKELCSTLGVRHFSRKNIPKFQSESGPFKSHCKHGNVTAWLHAVGFNDYDYLASFDPDHIPEKSFLLRTLGYFTDPDTGYVQAPQVYYNQSASIVARGAAEETYDYFSCVQMAAYGMGYPIILGSHNCHRMKALREVGGFAQHDADDLLLTAHYRATGWKGVYVPEILARGLTPVGWTSYLRQQRRWARSVLDLKIRHYPKLSCNLAMGSRIMSFLHGLNYFHRSLIMALSFFLLLAMLAGGVTPELFSFVVVSRFATVIATLQLLERYRQKFYLDPGSEQALHWRAGLMHIAKWPVMLQALYDALAGRKFPYVTTSKVKSSPDRSSIVVQNCLVIFLTVGSALFGAATAGTVPPLLHACAIGVVLVAAFLIATELRGFPDPFQSRLIPKQDRTHNPNSNDQGV